MSEFKKPDFHALQEKLLANVGPGKDSPFEYDELLTAFRYAEALERELSAVARLINVNMMLESVSERVRGMQSQAYRGYPEFKHVVDETARLRFDFAEEAKREIDAQMLKLVESGVLSTELEPLAVPEVQVLPKNDTPSTIKWKCYEYIGSEVQDGETGDPLTATNRVYVGAKVWVQGWERYIPMIVRTVDVNAPTAIATTEDGRLMATLEFGKDDRKCWASCGLGNLAAVQKLDLYEEKK